MNLVWAIVIIAAAVGASIAVMLLVRRGAPEGSYFSDGDRASGVFGVLATGFAIFAGFVIYLGFTSYDQSRTGAETEALTLVQQVETAQFLPAPIRDSLTAELVCYGRSVVGQEWPAMEAGTIGDTINPWAVALFRGLKRAEPRTGSEQSAHDKWLDQTSDREQARNDRIHGATGIVPDSLWIVLLLTAGVLFCYMLFFADSAERARSQAMLMGSAVTVVVVTLLAIYSLDNPYASGVGRLQPVAMKRALVLIDEARAVLGDSVAPPCDAEGRKVS